MSYDQGIRLPASSADQQRYHLQGPRFADPTMVVGDQGPRPGGFAPMDQTRMAFRPGVPFTQAPVQNAAPMEPRPPVHFTPQSETEKRIMEILESTTGLRRQQEEKQDNDKDPPSKPGTPVKSVQKETKTGDTGAVHDVTVPSTTASGVGRKPVLPVTSSKIIMRVVKHFQL